MSTTTIEWTDRTWNPLVGCSVISPGCTNCYAMKHAARLARISTAHEASHAGDPGPLAHYRGLTAPSKAGPVWTGTVRHAPKEIFLAPLHWKRGVRIFVNSMSDLFHEAVADEMIHLVLAVMAMTYEPVGTDEKNVITGWRQRHTYQVLTKRAERMRSFMAGLSGVARLPPTEQLKHPFSFACQKISFHRGDQRWPNAAFIGLQWVADGLPGLWLGVSAEDQQRADERIPQLLQTPAGARFVSIEPMLGPITLMHVAPSVEIGIGSLGINALTGDMVRPDGSAILGRAPTQSLDWVIVGGESGTKARPMHPDWVRDLREECQETKTPFFFKQWGEWAPGQNTTRTRGIVETADWFNGLWHFGHENMARQDGHRDDEPDLYRVGKKEAGAHLDGRLHREFPG